MNSAQCILEIDLAKVRDNYRVLSNFCQTMSCAKIGAVVKANSYGLGVDKIAPILQHEGCQDFFVFSVDEGIYLRQALNNNTNIFVLNGVFYNETAEFERYNLVPVLNNLGQVKTWQEFAQQKSKILPGSLHINTGMNRYGMPHKEMQLLTDKSDLLQSIKLHYIISHLSAGEELDNPYNFEQLKKFKDYLQYFPKIKASLSNSSSMFLGREYHFDLIRQYFLNIYFY
jgi:alanine racemase